VQRAQPGINVPATAAEVPVIRTLTELPPLL
jgi:hypothetical protein